MVAQALFSLAVASSFFALVRATAPWPTAPTGGVFNAGTQCSVTWLAATDGNWNPMSLELMTGNNWNMIPVMTLTTGLDGSKDGTFTYKCPEVDINGPIYFIRLNSSKSDVPPNYTTRFTIASDNGQTVPAPNATQPDGSAVGWGIGHLISGTSTNSTSTPTATGSSATGTSTGSSATGTSKGSSATGTSTPSTGSGRSSSHALTPTASWTSTAASGSPTSSVDSGSSSPSGGSGSGSGPSEAEPTVTSTTTVYATSTATRFTTKYIQSFVTVTATPSPVTTTATSTMTVTASPSSSSSSSSSPSSTNNAKVAATQAKSGALRQADLPVMHLLAFAVGSATAFITLLV